jgi:hypothetical protein
MSLASLGYDNCGYAERLRAAVGPGVYQLNRPANDSSACGHDVPNDPYMRWQAWGPGFCAPGATVDAASDLLGLPYKASLCSKDKYLPNRAKHYATCAAPAGAGLDQRCSAPTEDTRLSNPPCTLRGTGWNRWEWLCTDPQDAALVPFEWNTSYRTVVKDNFKPCLPDPMDQSELLPQPATDAGADTGAFLRNWSPPPETGAAAPGAVGPTWATCARWDGNQGL